MLKEEQPKTSLRRSYDLGRIRAMKDFLHDVRMQGGDIALCKMAYNILMYDEKYEDAQWIMKQYDTSIPSKVISSVEVVNPKTGEIEFFVKSDGTKVPLHFPSPIL